MNQTISSPLLPVADLNETCTRYLATVRPLLDDADFAVVQEDIALFQQGIGQDLHTALQHTAMQHKHDSWLIDAWLDSYLRIRTPLPLASNVGFALQTQGAGIAEWIMALANVCADYRHERIATPVSPQGVPMSMVQWQILRGASRIPQQTVDAYRFAENSQFIGILYRGWYYRVPALNEQGEAYDVHYFHRIVNEILAEQEDNAYPIAVPAYLGSDMSAQIYARLQANADNATMLKTIEEDLFHIALVHHSESSADDELANATFVPNTDMWCYKPMTFRYHLDSGALFLHCEHTWEDGGTLKNIVGLANAQLGKTTGQSGSYTPIRQAWQLDDFCRQHWAQWQTHYAQQARFMRVRSILIPLDNHIIPKGISQDALMQFVLQYAQYDTYQNIRNTYEAVDVSHFQSGRTECVRPISTQSVALIRALATGQMATHLLHDALAEHKARIKLAKQGIGVNRQLLGLYLEAQKQGKPIPDLFQSKHYRLLNTDFLSTSTIGDDTWVINFAFAPTSEGGLGINYTLTQQGWLFTVSHTETQTDEVNQFIASLTEGAKRLLAYIQSHLS